MAEMTDTGQRMALVLDELEGAHNGSFYTIIGAGGDLQEWIDGYDKHLGELGMGRPEKWYRTVGARVNEFAQRGYHVADRDLFQDDLVFLLFPLDGMDVGKLAMFKIQMQDRWFDDVVDNMRNTVGMSST